MLLTGVGHHLVHRDRQQAPEVRPVRDHLHGGAADGLHAHPEPGFLPGEREAGRQLIGGRRPFADLDADRAREVRDYEAWFGEGG
ncbi:hypothetical protein OG576_26805 [Streptomyces sp. NBC_01500]|nr:hypothetical protein [Streptomyces sp. NBC_01500]